jgi:hypothetical protein
MLGKLMTKLSMQMLEFMTNGHHFFYIYCACSSKKKHVLCYACQALVCHKYFYVWTHWASTMISVTCLGGA